MNPTRDHDRRSSGWIEAVDGEKRGEHGERMRTVRGYAILFDTPSEPMGRFIETIDPRALDHLGDLNKLDVQMLYGHDYNLVMARTTNGSLRLTKDKRGVLAEADIDLSDPDGMRLVRKIERGLITQQSFGFRLGDETVTEQKDGTMRAHVTRIDALYEVSPVGLPAYRDTNVEMVDAPDDEDEDAQDEDEPSADEDRSAPAGIDPSVAHARQKAQLDN